MEKLTIGDTDVILDNYGNGKGKITISNTYGYNFSHYWGSMGGTLQEFLLRIDEYYFCNKLTPPGKSGEFNAKLSVMQIRKYIREELSWDLPWHAYMGLQKEFREELKNIEKYSYSEDSFVNQCLALKDFVWSEGTYQEEKEFKDIIEGIFSEPWHYIVRGDSDNEKFLVNLLPKIKKELKKLQ